MNLNNKGFTLVEIIAVLIILVAIMGIAIPAITSSVERSKEKQNNTKMKMLESFAKLYVSDNKNDIYNKLGDENSCYIRLSTLRDFGYLPTDADQDADGNEFDGVIIFIKPNIYNYQVNHNGVSTEC